LIQSAAATVVTAGGSVPTAAEVATAVRANLESGAPIPVDTPTEGEIASAVRTNLEGGNPIPVNTTRFNNLTFGGTGVYGDPFKRPA
jgi:hypothetical protein